MTIAMRDIIVTTPQVFTLPHHYVDVLGLLYRLGERVAAIKFMRAANPDMSLKTAKDVCDAIGTAGY